MNEEHEHHEAETHPTAGDHSLMEHHSREDHANSHADPSQGAMDHGGMHPAETEGASHEHHNGQAMQAEHAGHDMAHADHSGHEQMFRRKFWISLVLSIPVVLFSPSIQAWSGFGLPVFPGFQWITPVFAVIVFFYGGMPFLKMAVPELKNRKPGMMTLISLAICVAFVYSLAALFLPERKDL